MMTITVEEFGKLRFGMFIHYNMATYKDAQWVEGNPSPADFNPGVEMIDTDAWADAAKSAGMTYAVLTTKHVAGFCLWDSKLTEYKVTSSLCPYGQDVVAQFVESFTRRGLKVGFYYLWRHPGFGDPAKYKALPPECDPIDHRLEAQIEFQKNQIAELIEMFPECFYIWNDGLDPVIMPADQARAIHDAIRPGLLASGNWWDWARKGDPYLDVAIKECRDLPEDNKHPAETCWTLEGGWFWQPGTKTSPVDKVIGHMQTAFERHSNFLLNIGPDEQGIIPDTSRAALAEIGQWYNRQL